MRNSVENLDIGAGLERMQAVVLDHGGYLHPEMVVHQSNDQLWISCKKGTEGEALLSIPNALFIPATQLKWQFSNGTLSYSEFTPSLSKEQQILLDEMVQIYNLTHKVATHQNYSLSSLLANNEPLHSWLTSSWTEYALANSNPALDFLGTRLIHFNRNHSLRNDVKYLMPFIDLINHHPNGPKIQTNNGHMKVSVFHSDLNSDECSLCYNGSDSLSIAYNHGYLDNNTDFIASLDCRLHHALIGEIHVIGNDDNRRAINAPRLVTKSDALVLQSIVLQKSKLASLCTMIALAVRAKQRSISQLDAELIAKDLIAMIIDANIVRYAQLHTLCDSDSMVHPQITVLKGVAMHQLMLLQDMKAASFFV